MISFSKACRNIVYILGSINVNSIKFKKTTMLAAFTSFHPITYASVCSTIHKLTFYTICTSIS